MKWIWVCRIVGWIFILAALFCVYFEISAWVESEQYHTAALGLIIFTYWPDFLPNLQAGVQRYLHPDLWDPVIQTILLWPGWAVFSVPGVILLVLCHLRRRRKPIFRDRK